MGRSSRAELDLSDSEVVKELALKRLDYSARTAQQMVQYLQNKGVDSQIAQDTVSWLKEFRFIDDAAYSQSLVRSRSARQLESTQAIRKKLQYHGIKNEDILQAIAELPPDYEILAARNLLIKRAGSWQSIPELEKRKKIYRILGTAGFNLSQCQNLIADLLNFDIDSGSNSDWNFEN